MVPLYSLRIPRVRRYSGYSSLPRPFAYESLTLFGWLSHAIRLELKIRCAVLTPKVLLPSVWPLPLSLATTRRISFDFSSSGYLDVSVPRVPSAYLCIQYAVTEVCSAGFPHSEISESMDICSSPKLFAAYHVFHRLLVPRHPPYALTS